MGGVLGRLFKVKKLELVLVGIENSYEAPKNSHDQGARATPPVLQAPGCPGALGPRYGPRVRPSSASRWSLRPPSERFC